MSSNHPQLDALKAAFAAHIAMHRSSFMLNVRAILEQGLAQFGIGGPKLKVNDGHLEVRNPADTAMEEIWAKEGSDPASLIITGRLFTTTEMTFYVGDMEAGASDDNDGSPEHPLKTIIEAHRRSPYFVNHTCRIFAANHGGDGYEWPEIGPHCCTKNIYVYGGWRLWNGSTWVEDPTHSGKTIVIPSTEALSGSSQMLIRTTGLSAGALDRKCVEVLDGPAAGDIRTIQRNTTTDIFPVIPFTAAIAAGNNFRVFTPSVKINPSYDVNGVSYFCKNISNGHSTSYNNSLPKGLYLLNMDLTPFYSFIGLNSNVYAYGIKFSVPSSAMIAIEGDITFISGMEIDADVDPIYYSPSVAADLGAPSSSSWSGWGVTSDYNMYLRSIQPGRTIGFYAANGDIYVDEDNSFVEIVGGHANHIICSGSSNIVDIAGSHFLEMDIIPIELRGSDSNALVKVKGSQSLCRLKHVDFGNAALGNGVEAYDDTNVVSAYQLSGNVAGIGMVTFDGGKILVSYPGSLTGTTGDFSEDGGNTKRLNATLTNGASFVDLSTLSKIYWRD